MHAVGKKKPHKLVHENKSFFFVEFQVVFVAAQQCYFICDSVTQSNTENENHLWHHLEMSARYAVSFSNATEMTPSHLDAEKIKNK